MTDEITTPPTEVSRRHPHRAIYVVLILSVLGLLLSGHLLYVSLSGGSPLPGCGPESACDQVLNSSWSRWLGIPVALPAAGLYLLVILSSASVLRNRSDHTAWAVLVAGAVAILAAAAWFTTLQVMVIGEMCPWCMATHAIGVVLAITVLATTPMRQFPRLAWLAVGVGALSVGQMVIVQILTPPVSAVTEFGEGNIDTGPGPNREIRVYNGQMGFSPHQMPMLGSPDAQRIALAMFDYTCPHCRVMHKYLMQAQQRYGPEQFAIALLPTPLDATCNPVVLETEKMHEGACKIAELAIAVWHADKTKFAETDAWLFSQQPHIDIEQTRAKAVELVGEKELGQAIASGVPAQMIARGVTAYKITNGGVIPKTFIGGMTLLGQPASSDEIFSLFEEYLGLIPLPEAERQSLQFPAQSEEDEHDGHDHSGHDHGAKPAASEEEQAILEGFKQLKETP